MTLRLTPESDGNASGFGLADISTRRAFEAMSFEKTYPNSLTARTVRGCMLPMIMESDYDAIRAAVKTAPAVDYDHIRCGCATPCGWNSLQFPRRCCRKQKERLAFGFVRSPLNGASIPREI